MAGFYPNAIIMLNDKKKHLDNVATAIKQYNPSIQFIGIVYEGAYTYALQAISKEDFQKFWEELTDKAQRLY